MQQKTARLIHRCKGGNLPGWLLAGLFLTGSVQAEPRLDGVFADHMVLQRGVQVPVRGHAEPGEKVTVRFAGQTVEAIAGADGAWTAPLAPMKENSVGQELTVTGGKTIRLKDVLLGDVWFCAGQSNMGTGFARREPLDPGEMNLPKIRYAAFLNAAPEPVEALPGIAWAVSDPKTVPAYPAFPWFFAQRLHQETGIPIGILKSNSGGARIEWFLNPDVVEPRNILGDWKYQLDCYENNLPRNTKLLEDWVQAAKGAKEKSLPVSLIPFVDLHPSYCPPNRFGTFCFYFGTISPLAKFPIKGVAWYQGESNVDDEGVYQIKLRSLIHGWRKAWNHPELPFYFVQLPSVYEPSGLPDNPKFWPLAREAQAAVLSIPNTGMAVTIDLGDEDLHPRNKYDMARRLADVALAKTYGMNIEHAGPVFRKCEIRDSKMILYFDDLGKGLMVGRKEGLAPTVEDPQGKLMEFGIAGLDRQFHAGEAVIEGDTVVVSSDKVPVPASVRYAFTWNPAKRNLYGRNGLPVAPFRTDTW